jgi:hypothetical protein
LLPSSKRTSANTFETSRKSKRKEKYAYWSKSRTTESSRSGQTHLHERPSKQLPKTSHLRQAVFEKGDPESSSELSNDHPENYPRRPIVSSDLEQSLFPEEPDSLSSDASLDTKRRKRQAKGRYKTKMLKLKYQ